MKPRRAQTTRLLNEYFDAAIAQCTMTSAEQAAAPLDLDVFADDVADRNPLFGLLLPAVSRAIDAARGGRSVHEATRLFVAIEAFEAKYGGIPESLDALVPEFLPEIPAEPVSGQPYVFVSHEPTADDPRSWWLYSAGLDATDNGGEQVPGGREWMAMSDTTVGYGYDYIFNALRDPWYEIARAQTQPWSEQRVDSPPDESESTEEPAN